MKSRVRSIISVVVGVLLGVVSVEGALRLYFHEHEANRGYWGRDAFVSDPDLRYRHASSVTAYMGRYGTTGRVAITFNADGYRDRRSVPAEENDSYRILLAGASFVGENRPRPLSCTRTSRGTGGPHDPNRPRRGHADP